MKKHIDNGRNKIKVGKNSASYNDKHPVNPIQLNPIGTALRATRNKALRGEIKSYSNLSRQKIATFLKQRLGF